MNIIEADLSKLFSTYGIVDFVVISRDKKTGRSKGMAFVEMPIQTQGEQAILALNNLKIDGLILSVQELQYKAGEFNN